jgi:ribose transport system permease protein
MKRFVADYGMIFALFLLCALFSWLTWDEQQLDGAAGGKQLAQDVSKVAPAGARVLIVVRENEADREFADTLEERLRAGGFDVFEAVYGSPRDARHALDRAAAGQGLDAIACSPAAAQWPLLVNLDTTIPALAGTPVLTPKSYRWPNFLKAENLLNVANQIVVIAIIAIGMTMVIITAGIDLSVGSLIAFSAVVSTWLIREVAGATDAGALGMILCCLGGIAACGALGLFSGGMVTAFGVPPFIVTLGMMLVGSGLAYILAGGQSIYQVPESFTWLGRGTTIWRLPNSVALMALLYAIAHVIMSRTVLGRYIYAIGGNAEAARLSGVPVRRVVLLVYALSGALAGLGGIITASQLKSGAPTYGQMYELYVIAAVVVGGTSLMGGQGKVLGTLIGAFIIAVIQNGMNLTDVGSYAQKVVLGLVILGAVLFDTLKHRGFAALQFRKAASEASDD